MNVCLITVDCLRRDFLTDEYADTPFLNRFAAEGEFFTEMCSTTSTTTPSVASYFTGRYSENNGVNTHHNVRIRDDIKTLAERFSEAGFHTYAMSTGPLIEETDLDRGFDKYWYRERNQNLTNDWKSEALDKRDSLEEPFFLYLHLWELHGPIDVPDEFDSEKYGDFQSPRLQKYTRALSALDRELEEFIGGFPNQTAVGLHGDHGEQLSGVDQRHHDMLVNIRDIARYRLQLDLRPLERVINRFVDYFIDIPFRDQYIEETHGHTVYDSEINVPFILRTPGESGDVYSEQCRQIDIYPTLLELANIGYSEDLDGKTLLNEDGIVSRKAYIRACGPPHELGQSVMRSVRQNGYKYIEYPERDWSPDLYDLSEDPNELNPISDDEIQAKLEREMPTQELRETDELEIDGLLKDLGYL